MFSAHNRLVIHNGKHQSAQKKRYLSPRLVLHQELIRVRFARGQSAHHWWATPTGYERISSASVRPHTLPRRRTIKIQYLAPTNNPIIPPNHKSLCHQKLSHSSTSSPNTRKRPPFLANTTPAPSPSRSHPLSSSTWRHGIDRPVPG